MKLSAPIHELKSRAKSLKKSNSVTLMQALNQVALNEGYTSWSLLQSKIKSYQPSSREEILAYLKPGDMMLLGARPGLGKTTMAIELMIQAVMERRVEGREAYLFSLEFTDRDLYERFDGLDDDAKAKLNVDFSDNISSDYIIEKIANKIKPNTIVVVDYLQLLDQKRINLELNIQLEALKDFAENSRCILILLSQIDRGFGGADNVAPSLEDIRMPNYFDLDLFNKIMLFNSEKMVFLKPKRFELS